MDRDAKVAEELGRKIVEFVGCSLEPYENLLYCLRNVPAKNLVKAFAELAVIFHSRFRPFQIVDKYHDCIVPQKEDLYNGGAGFVGSNPIVQIAGAKKLIEKDPRDIMESGNYSTDIPIMFGANKQEGYFMLGGKLS